MLVRASVTAATVMFTGMLLYSVDLRQTYDEMYPAETLRRDAFSLCHQSDPTFVRAIRSDRINCYDKMPNAFALAIGWARHGSGLAAPPPASGILNEADLFMDRLAVQERRLAAQRDRAALAQSCAAPVPAPAPKTLVLAEETGPTTASDPTADKPDQRIETTTVRRAVVRSAGGPQAAGLPSLIGVGESSSGELSGSSKPDTAPVLPLRRIANAEAGGSDPAKPAMIAPAAAPTAGCAPRI